MSKFDALPVTQLFTDTSPTDTAPSLESFTALTEYTLKIDPGSSLSEVFVIDGGFRLRARGQGTLETKLPAGDYLVKARAGDSWKEDWISLFEDKTVFWLAPVANSVAPIAETVGWSQAESNLADRLRKNHNLSIAIRNKEGPPVRDKLRIRRADRSTVADLLDPIATGWTDATEGRVLGMGGTVTPGAYLLQVETPGLRPTVMSLWVAPDCSTQVFLERRSLGTHGKRRKGPDLANASIFIVGSQAEWPDLKKLCALTETAKSVLSYDRALVPHTEEILESLESKGVAPMLGLLAAHLLRLKFQANNDTQDPGALELQTLLRTVLENLAVLMPGSPDVGALQLAMGLPSNADFSVPPMLAHSWALLQKFTASIPQGSYADRIRPAIYATRPWLTWDKSRMTADPKTPIRKRKRNTELGPPPEMLAAAKSLGKRFKLSVGPDGRTTLSRR